jgi:hypothetical protein
MNCAPGAIEPRQVPVGDERRERAPLQDPHRPTPPPAGPPAADLRHQQLEELNQPRVGDEAPEVLEDQAMIELIEAGGDIGGKGRSVLIGMTDDHPADGLELIVPPLTGPEPEAALAEPGLDDRLEHELHDRVHDLIDDGEDGYHPGLTRLVGLLDLIPMDLPGLIGPRLQLHGEFLEEGSGLGRIGRRVARPVRIGPRRAGPESGPHQRPGRGQHGPVGEEAHDVFERPERPPTGLMIEVALDLTELATHDDSPVFPFPPSGGSEG